MKIGAQLYTIRQFCKTQEDLTESLKKVADMGYTTVHASGICDCDPIWLKSQLDANGLKCVITHFSEERMIGDTEAFAKEHDILDCDHVGLGLYRFRPEEGETVDKYVETYGPVAKQLKACGKYYMHHNHAFEFRKQNGRLVIEQLAERFSADELGFTLDTYWVQRGGADPAQWLEKLSGRVPVIHLKDFAFDNVMAVLGEGNLNFDRIFEKAESAGTKYMLVEQDNCNGEDPFDCLRRSYAYLKANGFE